jgi:hypothetical protein
MENGEFIIPPFNNMSNNKILDENTYKFVGWRPNDNCINTLFTNTTINKISQRISKLLLGVDPNGRKIVVPDQTIISVLNEVYSSFRPQTGDMYTRMIIPSSENPNYIQNMINQTIEIIVTDVRNNLGIEEANSKLNIWQTVLGDFNVNGLRGHDVIKLRKRRPNFSGFVSFMTY